LCSLSPYFIIDVISAILTDFIAQCYHAAILAIMAKLAYDLVLVELSIAPNALVRCEYLVDNRHNNSHRLHQFRLLNPLANRRL